MTVPDLLYLALIAIGLFLDYFVLWPAFLRRSQADPGRARLWLWWGWMIMLWTLVAAGVALWLFEARARESLRLVLPHGWRLWGAIGLVLMLIITFARTVARIARSRRPKRIKMANLHVERLAPHTRSELGWWMAVSLSAGVCEEFIFRGYLIWVFQPVFGLWGAATFSVVVFAVAHAYRGAKGILATGAVGSLLTLVVLIFGSLLPAIALHTLIDIETGLVAWLALRKVQDAGGMITGLANQPSNQHIVFAVAIVLESSSLSTHLDSWARPSRSLALPERSQLSSGLSRRVRLWYLIFANGTI